MELNRLILLSGGHDSANLVRVSVADSVPTQALFVDYGQPASTRELCAAQAVADQFQVRLHRRTLPCLVSRDDEYMARNMLLLSPAVAVALEQSCNTVWIGCTDLDVDRFPDCAQPFIHAMDVAANTYGVCVESPARQRSSYIVPRTWSCYGPGPHPCGKCLSCEQPMPDHVDL